jgi:hypothetical protein
MASAGNGSAARLAGELFESMTGVNPTCRPSPIRCRAEKSGKVIRSTNVKL